MNASTKHTSEPEDPIREIVSTRDFAAPCDAVFRAFSDPRRLAQWWGPHGFTNTFHEFDLQPGGRWRLTMTGPDGTAYHNESHFVAVEPSKRIVMVHDDPVHGFEMTMTFADREGGTRLTWRMVFDSAEEAARVRAIVAGANEQNFDRLQQHLDHGLTPRSSPISR